MSPRVEYTTHGLRILFTNEEIEATRFAPPGSFWRQVMEGSLDVNTEDEKAAAEKQFKDIHGNIGPTEISVSEVPTRGERDFPPVMQQRSDGADRMLDYFKFEHLPERLQAVSRPWCELARHVVDTLPQNPERTVALRKLLEGKDAAVRAALEVIGTITK